MQAAPSVWLDAASSARALRCPRLAQPTPPCSPLPDPRAAYDAVEASLRSGGALKGALFWQAYVPGQVRGGVGMEGTTWCTAAAQWEVAVRGSSSLRGSPNQPLPRLALLPPQTASRGEGGGAGKFGVYPGSSTFDLVKAKAAAVQGLSSGSAGSCSKQGSPTAPPCADKG